MCKLAWKSSFTSTEASIVNPFVTLRGPNYCLIRIRARRGFCFWSVNFRVQLRSRWRALQTLLEGITDVTRYKLRHAFSTLHGVHGLDCLLNHFRGT